MGWRSHAGMAHGHLRFKVALIDQLDVEDQVCFLRNGAGTATHTVGKLPRDEEASLTADSHAGEALIEAGDQLPESLRKGERTRFAHLRLAVRVEFRPAILVEDGSGVVVG